MSEQFDPFKSDFFNQNKNEKNRKYVGFDFNFKNIKTGLSPVKSAIVVILLALIYYYVFLPPINIRSEESWIFILGILFLYALIVEKRDKSHKLARKLFVLGVCTFVIASIMGSKIFNAKKYANLIQIKESSFKKDISELSIDKIPTLDRDSSIKLGSRKMGELLDLVSQFDIDDSTYTQINFKDRPVRVTPLKYNGFIKYIFNSSQGLPGYLNIDIVTGETQLKKLENKIKISKQDYFFRDLNRYIRIRYPFEILGDGAFEIDEKGDPYWVIPTYTPKIMLFDGKDVDGAILVNASTGEHKKYELNEIPQWVDRVFKAEQIIKQLDWYGKLQGGFINSIFAQKNVLETTSGYNYLALDDDIYLYTGYTSVASDESNVGFILSNLRTKETKFYPVSSAEESSAMKSAEGAVQEKGYKSTFPLLLNVKGKPTYFLSLKDDAGLIKLYAFIDAQNYQNVAVGSSVAEAMNKHLSMGLTENENSKDENLETKKSEGIIENISSVVIKGNTYYYFMLQGDDKIYVSNISQSEKLPFIKSGTRIKFSYKEKQVNEIVQIESINFNNE